MAGGTVERQRRARPQGTENGGAPQQEQQSPLAVAMAHELAIAGEAAAIRGEATDLTPRLLDKLEPLLKKKIPDAFIQTVGRTQGKPYDSTGIKSVQVQIDRMNAVLGLHRWKVEREYHENGKLCEVTVSILGEGGTVLAERTALGGVDRASTIGNLYKGSFTNAAKLAFAQLGPGHEVYLGATDFDPDTDESAAEEQAKGQPRRASDESPENDEVDLAGDPVEELASFLATDHPLQAKRQACIAAMAAAGAGERQQLRMVKEIADDERALDDLTKRAENATTK